MPFIKKTFFLGLKVLIPLIFIILVFYWLLSWMVSVFAKIFLFFLPEQYYFFGTGLLTAFILTMLIGLILRLGFAKHFFSYLEESIKRIPLINSLYLMSIDLFNFFSKDKLKQGDQVVLVSTPAGKFLGILTTKNLDMDTIDALKGNEEFVAVYLPMSYQIGGFTILVPRQDVQYVNMTINKGMRLIMTAWLSKEK